MHTPHNFIPQRRFYSKCASEAGRAGFTLVELVVVVAVLGVLSVLLLPALACSRSDGRAFRCQNNVRQLALASIMYANDNGELLLPAGKWVNTGAGGNYEDWTANSGNTNSQLMLDTDTSALIAPYDRNPNTFKCPSDVYDGPIGPRARSYSMDGGLGGSLSGTVTAYQPNGEQRVYFSANKTVDLNTPGPAHVFVILDEHPDSINDSVFSLDAGRYNQTSEKWRDYPGSFHDGAVSISFADGHSEIHKWLDKRTCQPVEFRYFSSGAFPTAVPINSGYNLFQSADYEWLENQMPYHF